MQNLFKVVSQTEHVTLQKQDGSSTQKSILVLQELNGKYADSYVVTHLGNQVKFYAGDVLWASLRFTARDYNGTSYQDIMLQDFVSFTNH